MILTTRFCCLCLIAAVWPSAAAAQRAAENVIQSAEDAFGLSVGDETIGLYSPRSVRGFDPIAAGNIRLEGFFVDRQADYTDRLVRSSAVGAGLAAQSYLLPAPTGIVDFSLRLAADDPVQSIRAALEPFGGYSVSGDFQARSAVGKWEAIGGAGFIKDEINNGSTDDISTFGTALRYRPNASLDMTVLADYRRNIDQRSPQIFTANPGLPPKVDDRLNYLGQSWVTQRTTERNFGLLSRLRSGAFDIGLSVGRSASSSDRQAGQFVTNVTPGGDAVLRAFFGNAREAASTFLEAKVSWTNYSGDWRQQLTLDLRARRRTRIFGGTVVRDLGAFNINAPMDLVEIFLPGNEASREQVSQRTLGGAYNLKWRSKLVVNLGVQSSHYTRTLDTPGNPELRAKSNPVLFNASSSFQVASNLFVFGGLVRGFEEGPIAPDVAANRNEAPEALLTDQIDAGIKITRGDLTFLASIFRIEKPFFRLDSDDVFRRDGAIINRGLELSLVGKVTPELQVSAGALIARPLLQGDAVDQGLLSPDPISYRRRRVTVDLDYRPEWLPSWSFDASFENFGTENINPQETLHNPGYSTVNLGFRKTFSCKKATVVLRGRVLNIANTFAWDIRTSGGYFYNGPRTFSLSVAADFK